MAVDQPTNKLMQFLWKYYNLSKLVNQGNNFVIYEDFFENDGNVIFIVLKVLVEFLLIQYFYNRLS